MISEQSGPLPGLQVSACRRNAQRSLYDPSVRNDQYGHDHARTLNYYDANGFLVRSEQDGTQGAGLTFDPRFNRTFVNDAQGQALYVNQGSDDVTNPNYGINADQVRLGHSSSGYVGGGLGSSDQPRVSLYTAGQNQTLQGVAQAVYGDARLWYRIAQANGLAVAGSAPLPTGLTLTIPHLASSANNASTLQPYDPSRVTGSLDPALGPLPMPGNGDDCGGFGQIIPAVIAAVVTVYLGPDAGELTWEAAVQAAAAASAGNLAGQVTANAMGLQNGIDWRGVALSAVSGGITQGLGAGAGGEFLAGKGLESVVARAMLANALTQGVGVVTGLQKSFSWQQVAASAVGAGVGYGMNQALPTDMNAFARAGISSFAAGTAAAVARGGRVSIQQVATDAFGQALSAGFVDSARNSGAQEDSLMRANQENFRASEIAQQNAQAYRDGVYNQLLDVFSEDYSADRYAGVQMAAAGNSKAGAGRGFVNPGGTGADGQAFLDNVSETMRETRGMGPTRASMYRDFATSGKFGELGLADQRTVLAGMDAYSNVLTSGMMANGVEAKAADAAVRYAADQARDAGAIPEQFRFAAESRVGAMASMPWLQPAIRRAQEVPNSLAMDAASKMLRELVPIEPSVTRTLSDVAAANGGEMVGLEYRLKSMDSLTRKITAEPDRLINDALRYTISFDDATFTTGVKNTINSLQEQGFQQEALSNTFKPGRAYMGINSTYRTPEGDVFELQFHTPSSFQMKDVVNHPLYEQQRVLPRTDPMWNTLQQQMIQNSSSVRIPSGASTIQRNK